MILLMLYRTVSFRVFGFARFSYFSSFICVFHQSNRV